MLIWPRWDSDRCERFHIFEVLSYGRKHRVEHSVWQILVQYKEEHSSRVRLRGKEWVPFIGVVQTQDERPLLRML